MSGSVRTSYWKLFVGRLSGAVLSGLIFLSLSIYAYIYIYIYIYLHMFVLCILLCALLCFVATGTGTCDGLPSAWERERSVYILRLGDRRQLWDSALIQRWRSHEKAASLCNILLFGMCLFQPLFVQSHVSTCSTFQLWFHYLLCVLFVWPLWTNCKAMDLSDSACKCVASLSEGLDLGTYQIGERSFCLHSY